MFHHVRQCTISGFGNIALLAKLWSNYIIPLGYYTDSVRHALISLGASHRLYLGNYPDTHQPAGVQAYNEMAAREYAKATRHTARDLQNLDETTIRTSLVCCLVFVCCDIMQGRYDKAVFHLRSGSKMLTSLAKAATRTQTTTTTTRERLMAETVSRYFDQLCDIADMFSCIAFDTAFLMEEDGFVSDLSFFLRTKPEADPSQPFATAAEARYDGHRMERAFGSALGFTFRGTYRPSISWSSFLNIPGHEELPPTEEDYFEEWTEACRLFRQWSSRLDLYVKNVRSDPSATRYELWEAQLLSFIQKDWTVYIQKCENALEMPGGQEIFRELLEEAEALVLSDASMQTPTFTLAADVIPRLAFIAAFVGDAGLQRRAIDLLFSMKRREGLWDSREIASILESILLARECSLWDREFEKVPLPQLAGMLVSLNVFGGTRSLPLATLINRIDSR